MASDLYTSSTQFRADMNHFNEIALQQGFPPILALVDGFVQDLHKVSPVQMQVSLRSLWHDYGVLGASNQLQCQATVLAIMLLQISGILSVIDTIHPAFDFYGLVYPFINSPEKTQDHHASLQERRETGCIQACAPSRRCQCTADSHQLGTRRVWDLEKDPEPDFINSKDDLEALNDGSWIPGLSFHLMDGT